MIASLLPGLRDLRTPLAAGYLWLVAAWLLVGDHIPRTTDAAHGSVRELFELGGLVGTSSWLAAVSFVAYLVGGLTTLTPPRDGGRMRKLVAGRTCDGPVGRLAARWPWLYRRLSYQSLMDSYQQLVSLVGLRLQRIPTAALLRVDHRHDVLGAVVKSPPDLGEPPTPEELSAAYADAITWELGALGVQLQAANRDMWDSYDRYDAEEAFRYGVSLPLAVIVLVMGAQTSWWWLITLIVPLLLFLQALRLSTKALRTLVQAAAMGLVEPPVLTRLGEVVGRWSPHPGQRDEPDQPDQPAPPGPRE